MISILRIAVLAAALILPAGMKAGFADTIRVDFELPNGSNGAVPFYDEDGFRVSSFGRPNPDENEVFIAQTPVPGEANAISTQPNFTFNDDDQPVQQSLKVEKAAGGSFGVASLALIQQGNIPEEEAFFFLDAFRNGSSTPFFSEQLAIPLPVGRHVFDLSTNFQNLTRFDISAATWFAVVDYIDFGETIPAVVPLPAGFVMMWGSLAVLGMFGWRRHRRT